MDDCVFLILNCTESIVLKPVKKIFSQNIRFDFKPLSKYEQFC